MQISPHQLQLPPQQPLRHGLGRELPHLAKLRRRRHLRRDRRYKQLKPEINRVLDGFEWDFSIAEPAAVPQLGRDRVRAVAWNVERGKHFDRVEDMLRSHGTLDRADLVFLNEVDIGMGRSGNRNVARDLAESLGLNYVFANSHLVLAPGDATERDHGRDNTLALHGNALLTRFPVTRFEAVACREYKDKFHALEKRLGQKRSLLCEVQLPDGPLLVAVVHLDPFAPPVHRARQMRRILNRIDQLKPARVLLGGDLNTNTYDFGRKLGLAINVMHKILGLGVQRTIEHYMTPERFFERKLFRQMFRRGFDVDAFNDRRYGTHYFDAFAPEVEEAVLRYAPNWLWRWVLPKLEEWDGFIPMRLDWFAGRGLSPVEAHVVGRPSRDHEAVADHQPIAVDLALGKVGAG
jgi:endonuclease/exonuclease/phosphatase family metal-dependent hydrolase